MNTKNSSESESIFMLENTNISADPPDGFFVVKDGLGADKYELCPLHLPASQRGSKQIHPGNKTSIHIS
jgi:hypothetical protein